MSHYLKRLNKPVKGYKTEDLTDLLMELMRVLVMVRDKFSSVYYGEIFIAGGKPIMILDTMKQLPLSDCESVTIKSIDDRRFNPKFLPRWYWMHEGEILDGHDFGYMDKEEREKNNIQKILVWEEQE